MNTDRKAALIFQVIEYLKKENVGSVPEAILGWQKYADSNSEEENELRIIEGELIGLGLAKINGSVLNGFSLLNPKTKAYEINSKEDVLQLFNSEKLVRASGIENSIGFKKYIDSIASIQDKDPLKLIDAPEVTMKKQTINNITNVNNTTNINSSNDVQVNNGSGNNQRKQVVPNSKDWLEEMDKKNRKDSDFFSFSTDYLKHKQLQDSLNKKERPKWKDYLEIASWIFGIIGTLFAFYLAFK